MLLAILAGIGLAGVTVALVRALNVQHDLHLYAIGLIIAAFIYVGFALTQDHSLWVMVEIAGTVLFSAMAIAGWRFSPWWLVAGWLIHPFWDVVLHSRVPVGFVPGWYPPVCLGYDVAIGLVLAYKLSCSRSAVSQR